MSPAFVPLGANHCRWWSQNSWQKIRWELVHQLLQLPGAAAGAAAALQLTGNSSSSSTMCKTK